MVEILVDAAGDVEKLDAIGGHPLLVSGAINAVRSWKFKPVLLNRQRFGVRRRRFRALHAVRRSGRRGRRTNRFSARIAALLAFMAASAVLFGITGYVLARKGVLDTDWLTFSASPAMRYRFMTDWWAHSASYGAALAGGVVLCVVTYRRRLRPRVR